MFKFGHRFVEPNKNGRSYQNLTQAEFARVFNEVANRVAERGRYGYGNFIIIHPRLFDFKDDFKFGR